MPYQVHSRFSFGYFRSPGGDCLTGLAGQLANVFFGGFKNLDQVPAQFTGKRLRVRMDFDERFTQGHTIILGALVRFALHDSLHRRHEGPLFVIEVDLRLPAFRG